MRDNPVPAACHNAPQGPGAFGAGPLVPLLRPGEDPADPVTLDTWYQALSSALAADIPHDLFAFWLYPAAGGAVLLGPEALAADRLAVPEPPSAGAEQLALLESTIRSAGYLSTTCVISSHENADAGLLMFAALSDAVHGPRERAYAQLAADALGPTLARLARRWRADGTKPAERTAAAIGEAITAVSAAASSAQLPRELSRALSSALASILPHDRLELLVPGSSPEQWYRLGEHPGGPLWGDPDLVVTRAQADLTQFAERADPALRAGLPGEPALLPPVEGGPSIHSAIGVRLAMSGRAVGCLLIGSTEARRYAEDDAALLDRLGSILAPRIDAFVMAGHLQVLRTHVATQRSMPTRLARVLETLATVTDPAEATRRVQSEASAMMGFDEMWFALVLGDPSRVAMMAPGERRALPDLPQVAVGETPLGQVVRGETTSAVTDGPGRTDLIVPLRIAGRIIGAMVLVARREGMFGHSDEDAARGLADAVAPYLELLRRDAAAPPRPIPGWKRAPRP